MSCIIEFISRIITTGEMMPDDPRLKPEYFESFSQEWSYLLKYYSENRSLPNVVSFQKDFPEFEFAQPQENAQWLLGEIEHDHVGRMLDVCFSSAGAMREVNATEAAQWAMRELSSKIVPLVTPVRIGHKLGNGYCGGFESWRAEMAKITTGVPTGFALLDEVTFGTQPGEIEIWFGRTGEGKSLMLMHGAIAARHAGVKVSYVSPEMTVRENDIRYDAMTTHVSASGLFSGTLSEAAYNEFIFRKLEYDEMTRDLPQIRIRDSHNHAGRFTTADIAQIIKEDQPGLVIIDGLMLIEPVKQDRNMDIRKRIVTTMEELKTIATNTSVPIRLAHQASRESDVKSKRKKKTYSIDDVIPEMSHLAESSSVEQFANKIIAIKQWDIYTFLALRKNRNGKFPRFIRFVHDIDQGQMRDMQLIQIKEAKIDESIIDQPKASTFPDDPF